MRSAATVITHEQFVLFTNAITLCSNCITTLVELGRILCELCFYTVAPNITSSVCEYSYVGVVSCRNDDTVRIFKE